jgi:hypothetical protein
MPCPEHGRGRDGKSKEKGGVVRGVLVLLSAIRLLGDESCTSWKEGEGRGEE